MPYYILLAAELASATWSRCWTSTQTWKSLCSHILCFLFAFSLLDLWNSLRNDKWVIKVLLPEKPRSVRIEPRSLLQSDVRGWRVGNYKWMYELPTLLSHFLFFHYPLSLFWNFPSISSSISSNINRDPLSDVFIIHYFIITMSISFVVKARGKNRYRQPFCCGLQLVWSLISSHYVRVKSGKV
jgi:hypothetical protein